MTEKTYEGHEIPTYSVKGSWKFKDILARLLFNFERHQLHHQWWKMCVLLFCF